MTNHLVLLPARTYHYPLHCTSLLFHNSPLTSFHFELPFTSNDQSHSPWWQHRVQSTTNSTGKMARSRTRSRGRRDQRRRRSDSRRGTRPKTPTRQHRGDQNMGLQDGPMAKATKQLPPFIIRTREVGGEWVAEVDGATIVCNSTFFCTKCHAKLEGSSISTHCNSKRHIGKVAEEDEWVEGPRGQEPNMNTFQSAGFLASSTLQYSGNKTTADEEAASVQSQHKTVKQDVRAEISDFMHSPEGQTLLENSIMKIMMRNMLPPMMSSSSSVMPVVPNDPRLQVMLRPIGGR